MKDLLHDKKASRKAWIIFIVILVLGGAISIWSINGTSPVSEMKRGSTQLLVKNFTKYDVRVSGKLYGGFGVRPRMAFIVPAQSVFPVGPKLFVGRKGSTVSLRFSRVDDNWFDKSIRFNGYEGIIEAPRGITVNRLWLESGWLLLIEESRGD